MIKALGKFGLRHWLLLGLIAAVIVVPMTTYAVDLAVFFGGVIQTIIIQPLRFIMEKLLWILPMIAQYNGFTSQPGVLEGWKNMRDLSNIFFVLILLVIAFATILRFQRYGYKQLLSKYLLMAILINFSMTITGLLIDLSQIVMLTFVAAIKDVAAGNIIVSLGLSKIMALDPQGLRGNAEYIAAMVLAGVMMIITVIVIIVIIIMLAIRIIALWILVVISPLAFASYTFPKAKEKVWDRWLDTLTKYLISGPLLAFFLWLAFTVTGDGDVNAEFTKYQPAGVEPSQGLSQAATTESMINFIIGVTFLIAGLGAAAGSGVAGAGIAGAAKGLIEKSGTRIRKALVDNRLRDVGIGASGAAGLRGAAVGLGALGARGIGVVPRALTAVGNSRVGRTFVPTGARQRLKAVGQNISGSAVGRLVSPAVGMPFRTIGTLQQRAIAADERAQAQRQAFEEKRVEGLPSDRADNILRMRGGGVTGSDALKVYKRRQSIKEYVLSGKDADDPQKIAANQSKIARDIRLFQSGSAKDQEFADKLKLLNSNTADQKTLKTAIDKEGVVKAVQEMSMRNASERLGEDLSGNLDTKTIQVWDQLFKSDLKQLKKVLDELSDGEKAAWGRVLSKYAQEPGVMDHSRMVKKDERGIDVIDKNSVEYKVQALLSNLKPKDTKFGDGQGESYGAASLYDRFSPSHKALLSTELAKDVDAKPIARMDSDSAIYNDLIGKISSSKQKDILSEFPAAERAGKRKAIFRAQVRGSGIGDLLDNAGTRNEVDDEDIRVYFNTEINTAPTPQAKEQRRNDLAEKYLSKAHLAFQRSLPDGSYELDREAFGKFARENLKAFELNKLHTKSLRAIIPMLSAEMQQYMRKLGEAPSAAASDSTNRRTDDDAPDDLDGLIT